MAPSGYNHIDDKQLLENFFRDHDNKWLGILLPRYTLLLLGVCMKYLKNQEDAKDAVQQVFFKVINELHKYKVDYFKSWIYMIAKNHCLMKLRDENLKRTEINERMMTAADDAEDKLQHIEKDRTYNDLQLALTRLNKEQKQCIILFYLEKRSYSQISETTGFSMLQVKSFIQNGKRNLKQLMGQK
ncbi:sigma-70 family RNA polymerase sigma factor [soil metagenome]